MKFYIGLTLVTLLHVLGPALGQEPTVFKFRLNAVNVVDTDGLNEGIADPYAIVYSSDSAGTIIGKSEVILETVTPEWETVFEFTSSGELDQDLLIEVWDDDHGATPDDFLGSVLVNVRQFLDAEVNGGSLVNGSDVDAGTVFITRVDEELLPVLPRKLTEFELHHAAFVEAYIDQGNEESPLADRFTLYVSTFNPLTFAVDPKYYIRAPGRHLNTSIWPMVELDKTSFWPNNADFMPSDVAGVTGVVWTSGFLVPGKKKGQLELYDTSVTPPSGPINIAVQDEKDYSYHRVIWKDMDADGDLDALAPRFHVNLLGGTETELVWLENPGVAYEDTPTSGWNQHLIVSEGPDVHIRNTKLTAGGVEFDVIVAAEFWNEKLVLYYTLTGDWRNPEDIIKIELDTELGQTFDLYVSDINLDGRADIVVTAYNHTLGNVFAYEVPDDFRSEAFVKHTLADGFKANSIVGGQSMTPGGLAPFYPYESYKMDSAGNMRKPYIMLSGDDDGRHYILEPVSTDPTNWLYTKHTLVDTYGTTSGKFSVTDLDGDGYMEIVAAGYTSSTMYVFSYSPQ